MAKFPMASRWEVQLLSCDKAPLPAMVQAQVGCSEVCAGGPFPILLFHWSFNSLVSRESREKEQLYFVELVLKRGRKLLSLQTYSILPFIKGLLLPPIATSPSFLVAIPLHPISLFVCPMLGSGSTSCAIGHQRCSDIL